MNKFFTRIVGAALGLAMAIGVGVAVATSSNKVTSVLAADSSTTMSWGALTSGNGFTFSNSGDTYLEVSYGGADAIANYDTDLRLYSSCWFTISAKSTYSSSVKIKSLDITGKSSKNSNSLFFKASTGEKVTSSGTGVTELSWSTSSATRTADFGDGLNSVTVARATSGNQVRVTSIAVTYEYTAPSKYSLTYQPGEGTGDDYVVSNITSGSSVNLVSFATAGFTAPSNQQFKCWRIASQEYNEGDSYTVNASTTVTAIYEDLPTVPTISLSQSSVNGYTGQSFSVTATYACLTSAFGWGTPSGDGSITGSVTSTTGGTPVEGKYSGTSTYSGTLTSKGSVTLTASGGGATTQNVTFTILQTTVSLNKNSTTIAQGSSETLSATANVGTVIWESNNNKVSVADGVVSVSSDATPGSTATITATSTTDTNVSASCVVTVSPFVGYTKVTSIEDLLVGDSFVIGVENSSKSTQLMGGVGGTGTSTYRLSVDASTAFNSDKTRISSNSLPSGVVVVTLLKIDSSYFFYDITNGKYLAGQSGNYITNVTSESDATSYSISYVDGHLHVNLDNSTRVFGYNVGSPRFSTYASYASYNYTMNNGTAHMILFRMSGSSLKTNVTSFANTYLKMNDPEYEGDKETENCASNYSAMKEAYTALSYAEKNIFQFSADYSDARLRMEKWAAANHQTFTYGADQPFMAQLVNPIGTINDTNATVIIITVSVLSLIAVSGFVFISKRKQR